MSTRQGPVHFDAVIFDMDGVVTDSARLHAQAWKTLFDDVLAQWAGSADVRPFDIEADYRSYVDGKSRYDGVRSFLASRGIVMEDGAPSDAPMATTVCGVGNRKDRLFAEVLRTQGAKVFATTVDLVVALGEAGIRRGIASSSRNCRTVLELAGLTDLFEARVDGATAAELGIPGKPDPGMFRKCAELLQVSPRRAVVVEDALAGVRAARAGGFRLVVGIDRAGIGDALTTNGADVVLPDLAGVGVGDLDAWCGARLSRESTRA